MARLFTGNDAVVFPTVGFKTLYDNCMSFWWWPTFNQNDGLDHYVFECPVHYNYGKYVFAKFADNSIGGGIYYFGEGYMRVTNYTLLTNAWNYIQFPFGGSGGTKFCLNGVVLTTSGGGLNPFTGYSFTIGNNAARTASAAGAIGEFAIHGRALSLDHHIAFGRGTSPVLLDSDSGSHYSTTHHFPLWGIHDPEIDVLDGNEISFDKIMFLQRFRGAINKTIEWGFFAQTQQVS